jgi:G:T-mismatch repair DNA endonuclease (very short patch repair protein)
MPARHRGYEVNDKSSFAGVVKKRTELLHRGWRVLTVWECTLVGKLAKPLGPLAKGVEAWLKSEKRIGDIG